MLQTDPERRIECYEMGLRDGRTSTQLIPAPALVLRSNFTLPEKCECLAITSTYAVGCGAPLCKDPLTLQSQQCILPDLQVHVIACCSQLLCSGLQSRHQAG